MNVFCVCPSFIFNIAKTGALCCPVAMVTADEPPAPGLRALVYLVNLRRKLNKIKGIRKADIFILCFSLYWRLIKRPEAFSCQNRGYIKAKRCKTYMKHITVLLYFHSELRSVSVTVDLGDQTLQLKEHFGSVPSHQLTRIIHFKSPCWSGAEITPDVTTADHAPTSHPPIH